MTAADIPLPTINEAYLADLKKTNISFSDDPQDRLYRAHGRNPQYLFTLIFCVCARKVANRLVTPRMTRIYSHLSFLCVISSTELRSVLLFKVCSHLMKFRPSPIFGPILCCIRVIKDSYFLSVYLAKWMTEPFAPKFYSLI